MKTLRCTLTSVSETEQEQDTFLQINHLTDYKLCQVIFNQFLLDLKLLKNYKLCDFDIFNA